MKLRMPILLMMMVLAAGLILPAQTEAASLRELLDHVPAPENRQAYSLSYIDYEALVAARPGAAAPKEGQSFDQHIQTEEGKAYAKAMGGAGGGVAEVIMIYRLSQQAEASNGFSLFELRRGLRAGQAPQQQYWLEAAFDRTKLEEALGAKGYEALASTGEVLRFCEGGDCDNGSRMNLDERDPTFLFGGDLGRKWPVALSGDLLASTQDGTLFRRFFVDQQRVYGADPWLDAILFAMEQEGGDRPTQFLLEPASWGFNQPDEKAGFLAIAQYDGDEAQTLLLALTMPSLQEARKAQEGTKEAIEQAQLSDGSALLPRLASFGNHLREARAVESPEGNAVLLHVLRFPTQAEAAKKNPDSLAHQPFVFFVNMMMRRDLAWLMP